MSVAQLLKDLAAVGAKLEVASDKLKCHVPTGALSPQLQSSIQKNKQELIDRIKQHEQMQSVRPALKRRSTNARTPLSFAQKRLWFFDQYEPGNPFYNMPLALQLSGLLDAAILKDSFNDLIRRHESLRTIFTQEDGIPYQKVQDELLVDLPTQDLSGVSGDERKQKMDYLIHHEAAKPFDLASGPLIRISLIKLGEQNHVLLITTHHIISDGWSTGLVLKEVAQLYDAYRDKNIQPLPDLKLGYPDYASWQQALGEDAFSAQIQYWKNVLDGAPPCLVLPTDFPKQPSQNNVGSRERITLPWPMIREAENFARANGTTLYAVLLSAIKILLSHWTNQKDIVVGTIVAGRTLPQTETIVGCFINTLAVRSSLSAPLSIVEFVRTVSASLIEAYQHQDCPFEKVIEAINPQRIKSVNPICNVGFLLQNFPVPERFITELAAKIIPISSGGLNLDLRFIAGDLNGEFVCGCEYSPKIFNPATISTLLKAYVEILACVIQKPKEPIASINLPSALVNQAASAFKRDAKLKVNMASTFTVDLIRDSVEFWMDSIDIPIEIEFAPYGQVFPQLLNTNSLLGMNSDINVILFRLEDWIGEGEKIEDMTANIEKALSDFKAALTTYLNGCKASTFIFSCPPSRLITGRAALQRLVEKTERELKCFVEPLPATYYIESNSVFDYFDVEDYEDTHLTKIAHIPYSVEMFNALGTVLSRKIAVFKRLPKKVIVLDCDQTLWKGICAEDQAAGISLSAAYIELQKFILKKSDEGMLICLCSKNDEVDVFSVFAERHDMLLKLSHITAHRINWLPKSENLQSLAAELNIGLNSMIFIDDNPLECAEVEINCPDVLVLQIPENIEELPEYLMGVWEFDTLRVTDEASRRAESYRHNSARLNLQKSALSFEDYLASLEVKVSIDPIVPEHLERISELTQRTNQFNLSTIRRSVSEIRSLLNSGKMEGRAIRVRDRFGDYGLTGAVFYHVSERCLFIDTFLLSCRVLGRRVEHHTVTELAGLAVARGCDRIVFNYVRTDRNTPIYDFLVASCSRPDADTAAHHFELELDKNISSLSA